MLFLTEGRISPKEELARFLNLQLSYSFVMLELPWGKTKEKINPEALDSCSYSFPAVLYLCIFQEIVETVKECCENGKRLANDLFLGKEETLLGAYYHWKLSKFVLGDLISIRIPLIRNLHILPVCSAYRWVEFYSTCAKCVETGTNIFLSLGLVHLVILTLL